MPCFIFPHLFAPFLFPADCFLRFIFPRILCCAFISARMYEPLTKIEQVILPAEQKDDILTSINVFSAYRQHRRKMDQSLSDDRQLVTGLVLMLCGPPGTGKTVTQSIVSLPAAIHAGCAISCR
jgi:hypothetical protein